MKLFNLLVLTTISLLFTATFPAQAQTITPTPLNSGMLTDSNNDEDRNSDIATDSKGNCIVAWVSINTLTANFFSVKTATSTDNGQTFNTPVQVGNADMGVPINEVAIDVNENGTWIVSWIESTSLYTARSLDNGSTWSDKKFTGNLYSNQDIVALSGNRWHILGTTIRNSAARIISSSNDGMTWSENVVIGSASRAPKIKCDSADNLYATWDHSGSVWASFSSDNGNSWIVPKRVGFHTSAINPPNQIVDSNGDWFIVWDGLQGVKSSDQGQNFSELLLPSAGDNKYPDITFDEQNRITIGWISKEAIHDELFFIRSADGGATWSGRIGPFDLTPFRENLQLNIKSGINNKTQCVWTAFYTDAEPFDNDILYSQFDSSLFDNNQGTFDCFIDQNYRDLLRRPADTNGRQFYAEFLETNIFTPEDFILQLAMSDEFNNLDGFIIRTLIALYNDNSKFNYDYRRYKIVSGENLQNYRITILNELAQGATLNSAKEKFIDQLIESDEWQRRLGDHTNEEFVDQVLYKNILGRAPNHSEFTIAFQQIHNKQKTWDSLIVQMIDSGEAKLKYENHVLVTTLFLNLLELQTRRIDWEFWMNKLQTNEITKTEAIAEIIRIQHYRNKLNANGCTIPF